MPALHRRKQQGAVIITVAMMLLFLLGFMGIALDFGRLFVVKTELQTAMDSCALSAAQELDGLADSTSRARSAGLTASNLNRVDLQSSNWSGQGQLTGEEITFRDAAYQVTTDPFTAKYAQCQHVQPSIQMLLLHALGAFSGNTTLYPSTRNVGANAVATRGSTQTTCPIPIGLKRPAGGTPPLYGVAVGEWVTVWGKDLQVGHNAGEFGWYNLDESQNAKSTKEQLEGGVCNTRLGAQLRTPGAKSSVDEVWNYRFGIYKNNVNHGAHPPDYSGYSYTATNWKNAAPQNAWSGTPAAGSAPSAGNFITKRSQYRSFDDTGTDLKHGSGIVFGDTKLLANFKDLSTPGGTGEHRQLGGNRRIALIPVLDESSRVIDYLCIFMLHPLTGPNEDVRIEVRGNAGTVNSPCTTSGIPGGAAGPLVPVLVR